MSFEITGVEATIESIIASGGKQKDVAEIYALSLVSSYKTDYEKVNRMIMDRWSVSARNRVVDMAWKIMEQRRKEATNE